MSGAGDAFVEAVAVRVAELVLEQVVEVVREEVRAAMSVAPGEEDLLTTAQAAAQLGLQPVTLAKWRRSGEGPQVVRCGSRSIRYRRADVVSWAAAQKERA